MIATASPGLRRRLARRAFGLVAMAVLTSACGPRNGGTNVEAGMDGHRGIVRVTGSAPVNVQTVLRVDDDTTFLLAGDLVPELQNARGAEVIVSGLESSTGRLMVDGQILVDRYLVVSVDGEPVLDGEIVEVSGDRGRLLLAGGEQIEIRAVPESFRVGQRVWIQGPGDGTVQSYGILKP